MKRPSIRNHRGQMTIEMLCLITIFLIIALTVQQTAIQQGWLKNLIEAPWKRVQGIIENGVWLAPDAGRVKHPHIRGRHGSLKPEPAP
jgi:hypothetical protein